MEDAAREARNRYKREWYAKNKDKQREYEHRYWMRIADSDRKKTEENGSIDDAQISGNDGDETRKKEGDTCFFCENQNQME